MGESLRSEFKRDEHGIAYIPQGAWSAWSAGSALVIPREAGIPHSVGRHAADEAACSGLANGLLPQSRSLQDPCWRTTSVGSRTVDPAQEAAKDTTERIVTTCEQEGDAFPGQALKKLPAIPFAGSQGGDW